MHRPAARRSHGRRSGRSSRPGGVLLRSMRGRRLEDRRRGHLLAEHLRWAAQYRLRRRDRRVRLRPQRHLRWHGRGLHQEQRDVRGWRLPLDRRRQDLDPPGPVRHPPHLPRAHPSHQPRHRVRRCARPRIWPKRGARHLPLHRRRQELGKDPVQEREFGSRGPLPGSQ